MAPVLGYWSLRGLAEPIRYMLHYTTTEFEDKQYTGGPAPDYDRSQWTSVKETLGLEFPNLPYYIDGDIKITESQAILSHLARKNGLAGSSELEKIKLDMAFGIMSDVGRAYAMLCYGDNFETNKVAFLADFDTKLKKLSTLLGSGDYVLGHQISLADFNLFELLERFCALAPDCCSSFPSLTAFQKRFSGLPAINKYRNSPSFQKIKTRFNGRMAKFGGGEY